MSTTRTFLPWVRQGFGSAIATPDSPESDLPASARLPMGLRLNTGDTVTVPLRVRGPGDVVGLDRGQVVREVPGAGEVRFPPSRFPAVEFERSDLPWLFTPAGAGTQGRLRPWLVLVVVREGRGVTLHPGQGNRAPVLEIKAPARPGDELPDLTESWAWAHAQAVHGDGALDAALEARGGLARSRLLCPRRLEANTPYLACLVPAFEVGRRAGLGLPVENEGDGRLSPAWESGSSAPSQLRLPVYHQWRFTTGEAGDFESAVRRFQARRPLPAGVGSGRLHLGRGGTDVLPDLGVLPFAGVFRHPSMAPPLLPPSTAASPALRGWIEQLGQWLAPAAGNGASGGAEPVVTLPLYGGFQQHVRDPHTAPAWLRDLNLEPRNRAAAGLGVLFVQWHQERLMADAWDQLGEASTVRRVLLHNELAQAVGSALYTKRFVPMLARPELLLQCTAPAHARLLAAPLQTLAGWAAGNGRPPGATLSAFRRVTRPGGVVMKRLRAAAAPDAPLAVARVGTGETTPTALRQYVAPAAARVQLLESRRDQWRGGDGTATRAAAAIDALLPHLRRMTAGALPGEETPQSLSAEQQQEVLAQLKPAVTVGRRTETRLQALENGMGIRSSGGAGLFAPTFHRPMVEAVREMMPSLLLAGAGELPDDSVTVLETNPQFIEAFLLGANHEMARELLWRGFPADLRGTFFRHFWGTTAGTNAGRAGDIPELATWQSGRRLGDHFGGGSADGHLALVVRGELFRRFPGTLVYAVRGSSSGGLSDEERYPVHRGRLTDDTTFLLFDLTEAEARGEDGGGGWFFMLQEQPTEAGFGLDLEGPDSPPEDWSDLAWAHVATGTGGYIQVLESAGTLTGEGAPPGPTWGFNGAHMAHITLQRPFRVGLHARRLL